MQDVDKILEALRAPHLPPGAAGLTFGDLALPIALGLLAALLVALLWPTRIKGRRRIAASVLRELDRARSLPPEEALLVQARLLRRVVAARDGDDAARLQGAAFARHLDKSFETDFFSRGPGRSLALALYEPQRPDEPSPPPEAVFEGLAALFRQIRA